MLPPWPVVVVVGGGGGGGVCVSVRVCVGMCVYGDVCGDLYSFIAKYTQIHTPTETSRSSFHSPHYFHNLKLFAYYNPTYTYLMILFIGRHR